MQQSKKQASKLFNLIIIVPKFRVQAWRYVMPVILYQGTQELCEVSCHVLYSTWGNDIKS